MPITHLTIENFKGISDKVEIPLRPVTLLFGANSAGRSTIFQALLYIRELLERRNLDADRVLVGGEAIRLGEFRRCFRGLELNGALRIAFTRRVSEVRLPFYRRSDQWCLKKSGVGCGVFGKIPNSVKI